MATVANPPAPLAGTSNGSALLANLPRALTILVTAAAVLAPLSLIFYQSFLSAPFFDASKTLGLDAYEFIFADSDFWQALLNSILIAAGMTLIAIPLGGVLAFVMERTDFPGKRWIEPMLLVPSFVSPMVLAFGYVVAAGPVGFYSVWATELFGGVPWGIYSLPAIGRHRRASRMCPTFTSTRRPRSRTWVPMSRRRRESPVRRRFALRSR